MLRGLFGEERLPVMLCPHFEFRRDVRMLGDDVVRFERIGLEVAESPVD